MSTLVPSLAEPDFLPPEQAGSAPSAPRPGHGYHRYLLLALLAGTAILYIWGLDASGTANDFYAAAVQAGTKSWKAFFFGSFDSSNFITVDKPPASLWVMELSGRIFGFNSWSMLVPQALEGVAAVALLYATVKRWFGPYAGLIAGALLAITPVAVLMFRFNNPDALMTLLIVAAAYCVTRAIEAAGTRWLLLAGVAIGFSFLTKGLQPFTVVPAFAIAYLVATPTGLGRRIWQLLAAGAAILVSAGWWVLAVQLTPAADRPYIGGSTNNSVLDLAFGYNGLGRITGSEGGGGGGGGGGGVSFSGSTGIGRLFNSLMGGQISWLLPAAIVAVVALAALTRRTARTDRTRAALIVWGGWLLVTGGVLSFASGVIHTYYTIELAPAIAALIAIGAVTAWRHRTQLAGRAVLAAGVAITGIWSFELLHRSPSWYPWISYALLVAATVSVVALLVPSNLVASRLLPSRLVGSRLQARTWLVGAIAAAVVVSGGSAAYAVDTASTAHTGSIPSAGPTVSGGSGFGGPGFGGGGKAGGRSGGFPGGGAGGGFPGGGAGGGFPGGGSESGPPAGAGGFPGGSSSGGSSSSGRGEAGAGGQLPGGTSTDGSATRAGGAGAGFGGAGGGGQSTSAALVKLLKATKTTWAAATVGSQTAAPIELSSGKAVMAIGGFTGSDPSTTLAQFEKLVSEGKIAYFIPGGAGGGPGGAGSSSASAITSWVESHFKATTVGGTTVYKLTTASS